MRTLKVAYKTVWYHTGLGLPAGLATQGLGYVGDNTLVLGALEDGGNIRLRVEKLRDRRMLQGFPEDRAPDIATTEHRRLTRSEGESVSGDSHPYSVEIGLLAL